MHGSWPQIIVHADMDAFYAAVEQLDRPELRGRPVIVGHASDRGVVLTASYEARVYGVGSAMPMVVAKRRCPQAIVVGPRFDRYRALSQRILATFGKFSPSVEPLSLDEAFIDVTGTEKLFGPPRRLAQALKEAVRCATGGLTVSVGISATKFVAKVASAYCKPDGLTIVPPSEASEWLSGQPISSLWGVGPKTEQHLRAAGANRIGDLCRLPRGELARIAGSGAQRLLELARGVDPRPVDGERAAISISSERTFEHDIAARARIALELRHAAEDVAQRLRRKRLLAQGVRIKLKTHDFRLVTRQLMLQTPTNLGTHLHQAAIRLLNQLDEPGPFRLAGLGAYGLSDARINLQQSLEFERDAKSERLERTLDRLQERFGADSIRRGAAELDRGIGEGVNLDFTNGDEDA